jgi:hypothetical protein
MLAFILNLSGPIIVFLALCYFIIVMIAIFTAIKNTDSLASKIILVAVFVFIPFSAIVYLVWNKFNNTNPIQSSGS